jgi:hypothetical protein
MASTSSNLSGRIFFTLVHTNGTGYIGELEIKDGKKQKILVNFSREELTTLIKFIFSNGAGMLHDTELEELAEIVERELSKEWGLGKYIEGGKE